MDAYTIVCASLASMGVQEQQCTPDARLADLGLESLQVLQVLFDCERAYGIKIPDDALYAMATIADVVAYMEMPYFG